MNLSQLYYFNKLAELEHYTKAAKELYITQPALSDAIHALENELGIPLFQRVGRNVKLTKYGREFNGYVTTALREIDKGVAIAKSYKSELGGKVNIGAIYTVMGDYLPALFAAYRENVSSSVKFDLFQGFSLDLLRGLEEETYDVVFCAKPAQPNEELVFTPTLAHQLVAVVSKDHPLASKTSVSLADLKGSKVLTYRAGTPIGEELSVLTKSCGIDAIADFQDEITLGGMAQADASCVSLCTLSIGLMSYRNISILPVEGVVKDFHKIYMVTRNDDFQSYAVESFVSFTKSFVAPEGIIPSIDTTMKN